MEFILGCNYWASNAGADMWKNFDIEVIDKDLCELSKYGIKYLRVFPSWREFQPVSPLLMNSSTLIGYATEKKSNKYYLDEEMLERFSAFLDVCDKYGMKTIVGLVTGFMSGSMLIPTALYGKNIITDPVALYFQQIYIKGMVSRFKDREAIYAWDLGNECNEMGKINCTEEASNWTATVSNAIRASDNTRPVVSGMHYLSPEKGWTIYGQAEFNDILTTHPYPYWCEGTRMDETLSLRNTLFATGQSKYYAEIGKKPCLAEEMGSMGPMVCSNEHSADFLRTNLFSLWANGAIGAMWWCAHDQTELNTFPYTIQMVERELGLLTKDYEPKPALLEYKKFSEFLSTLDLELPSARTEGVCILSRTQRQWGVAFVSYILARQAGFNVRFEYSDAPLEDSPLYILPSVNDIHIMPKNRFDELKQRVANGSDLYISLDNAILAEFESLAGIKVIDSYASTRDYVAEIDGTRLEFSKYGNLIFEKTTAEVLAYDNENNVFLSENKYGKGRVFVVNAPIEANLIEKHDAFRDGVCNLYKKVFKDHIDGVLVKSRDESLLITTHDTGNGLIVVAINHSPNAIDFDKIDTCGYKIKKFYYGSNEKIAPYDACVFKVK